MIGKGKGHARGVALPAPSTDGSCPNAARVPRSTNLAAVGDALLCLINRQRALAGLAPLRASAPLTGAAQRHSDDMARTKVFDHRGSAGDTLGTRIDSSGYLPSGRRFMAAENIAWVAASLSTPAAIVAAWMASAEHRANILDAGFRDTGIGLSLAPPARSVGGVRGTTVTEDFGSVQ